ncbi:MULTISPECIES: energy-coupling factor ABC transporter ATP-binding protein [Vibrio]|jgi:tungstate transport system ATP-binding protein|uniref:Energy-coupling factor ABC transporter ATP-binding protein n=1 Tax=Vibrio kanaloae TaxID=170673 RepID=A0ABV4LEG6_9VIBR|nr:energy-coupling factor ABC transporter ATP-binding protein [Vibrio kanaloae]KAB0464927.1 energy-coupling factor ABC transporter ATP-binding protein [Vibrio kanaloae]NOJ00316.1 energy-coupling factor ABC transporter ATP-binding protein [Vibrio kanaloae]OEF14379.1 ABC transporter ATP-binding protein [Vibrio kanaloae 5S-149]PMM06285.1 ABC transporter ATP-binding protein [Vibrio kanaloae]TKE95145.1 energy-coupling factor ABC transporter ATP-binding protein [Vibrio kanaloae]
MSIKITTQQISMRYKERVLFHIPELSIGPNDAIYLKGDNGVGKTTLLKILSGLLKPSSGRIQCPTQSWQHNLFPKLKFKDIIYLHQTPYLFDGSVYQNVAYGVRFNKESQKDKRAQIINALRMVGLETLADEHISVLSGGERQRVAMARAWILKPSILLMDEPSASLDKESIERLVIMAEDLLQRGASLVITSHQTNALTDLCKKQWWIKDNTLTESPLLQVIKKNKAQENIYAASNAN